MEKANKRIAANIKGLRTAVGESQMELAVSLGLSSSSTISMYESGKRVPDLETLSKIAGHFRIAVDELINNDYSEISAYKEVVITHKAFANIIKKILPIACSSEATEKDVLFARAYEYHLNLMNAISQQDEAGIGKYLEACYTEYEKSQNEKGTIEAVANKLWILFFYGYLSQYSAIFEYNPDVVNRRNSLKENAKNLLLKHYDDQEATYFIEEDKKERKSLLESLNQDILHGIKALKNSPKWTMLADYYLILYYLFDMAGNDLNETMNFAIGRELLYVSEKLGNPYAKTLMKVVRSYYE